ncbi:MAG: aromatic ring-opening dioxygenase LigA [Actinomycetota bacterium]|nr:aromatic ring-opening dioxygenase LigA [Actinomycetota bacterium]
MSGRNTLNRWLSIAAIAIGAIMIIAGIATWVNVSKTLEDQRITVASDASCMADSVVTGPITAYCQAEIINKHALEATGGKTYAELDREDPLRATAMTSSFLQASLYTSVVAFGVALMAMGIGLVFILLGIAVLRLSSSPKADPVETPSLA